ncbi:metallophosphoesterase [Variovorax sp. J31P179]|uniref:metallophosphoesterase n=1 Tax=Variovorax sp. J31P179 TaxID=3053508 RepID=UPI00257843E1|nr:metallophosphoesterase [Variovorax sp. J31P179]MDM0081696.1 metallophosphoesterase [Variovorax sp. J31P179]
MKLLILSDLHAEFETFEAPKGLDYDVAILAGDIVAPGRAVARWLRDPARFGDKPVVQIAGNHEYYESVLAQEAAEMRRQAKAQGIHFLDCDEVVIAGVRFLGCTLWTDFRLRIDSPGFPGQPVRLLSDRHRSMMESLRYLADYSAIRIDDLHASNSRGSRRLVPTDTLLIHRRHRSWLRRKLAEPFEGPTVVVTHHAPHRNSLAARYAEDWCSGGFVSEMRSEFFEVPLLWVHGHTHDSFDYQVGNCRVISNPRGYLNWHGEFENKAFNPRLLVEVDSSSGVGGGHGNKELLDLAREVFGNGADAW